MVEDLARIRRDLRVRAVMPSIASAQPSHFVAVVTRFHGASVALASGYRPGFRPDVALVWRPGAIGTRNGNENGMPIRVR